MTKTCQDAPAWYSDEAEALEAMQPHFEQSKKKQ